MIGRIGPDRAALHGDWRVNLADAYGTVQRQSIVDGQPKVWQLRADIAVGFAANDSEAALRHIQELEGALPLGREQIADRLQAASLIDPCDFLLLTDSEGHTRLERFQSGTRESGSVMWIGDHEAFSSFQSLRPASAQALIAIGADPESASFDLDVDQDAFRRLVALDQVSSTGQLHVQFECRDHHIQPIPYATAYHGRPKPGDPQQAAAMPVEVDEGFKVEMTFAREEPAVSLYWEGGKLGCIWRLRAETARQVARDMTRQEYGEWCRQLGLTFTGRWAG